MKFIKNKETSVRIENIEWIFCSKHELVFYFKENLAWLNQEPEFYEASGDEDEDFGLAITLENFFNFLKDPSKYVFDLNEEYINYCLSFKQRNQKDATCK